MSMSKFKKHEQIHKIEREKNMQNIIKIEDLKTGMKVKFKTWDECKKVDRTGYLQLCKQKHLGKVQKITEIFDEDGMLEIEPDKGMYYHVDWVESIVEPEKVQKVYKFEDLKVGMYVRLKRSDECKDRHNIMSDMWDKKQCYGKVVTISHLDNKDKSFLIEECYGWFCLEWISEICQPEKVEEVQNSEPDKPYKVEKSRMYNTDYWMYTLEDEKFSIVYQKSSEEYVLTLKNFTNGTYLSFFKTLESCESYALEQLAKKKVKELTQK